MLIRNTDSSLFRFCPECGQTASCRAGTNFFLCGECSFRIFFNVATAAGVFLKDREGRYLFIRRAHDPARGKLGVPGGFVDPGESAEQAAIRELGEEIGLQVNRLHYLGSHPNRYEFGGLLYYTTDIFFHGTVPSFNAARSSREVDEIVPLLPEAVDPSEVAFDSMRWALARIMTGDILPSPPQP